MVALSVGKVLVSHFLLDFVIICQIKILVLYNAKKHFAVFLLWHISDPEQSAVIFQV